MAILASYINNCTLTIAGTTDYTSELHTGRRIKADCGIDGYKYGTISGSSYSGSTTVVIYPDPGDNLTSNLTEIWYGIVSNTDGSLPNHDHLSDDGMGGLLSGFQPAGDYATNTQLTTTSGDIVSQIPSLTGYATQAWSNSTFIDNSEMTTISGNIVAQIPSLSGYATQSYVSTNYVDNTEMTTISGDIVSQIPSLTGYASTASLTAVSGTLQDQLDSFMDDVLDGEYMVYPDAGIALSTGSAWGTSITNNSENWNTAYGWGDHTSAGYLTAASTGVTGDWTINSDLGDVTSKLIFGRTTGGNGEISWNGTNIGINKYTAVTVANGQVAMRLIGDTGRLRIYPYDSATYGTILQAMQTDEESAPYYIPMTFGANPFIFYYGQVLINATSAIGTEKLRVNGDIYADGAIKSASDITINSDLGNVTSKLIFGRTTGGNGEISYDGSCFYLNKLLSIDSGGGSHIVFTEPSYNSASIWTYHNQFGMGSLLTAAYRMTIDISTGQIGMGTTSFIGSEKLRVNGDIYADGNISGLSFTDRTPYYEGDALSEIIKIKGKDGQIDHSTLPDFVRVEKVNKIYEEVEVTGKKDRAIEKDGKYFEKIEVGEEISQERDLGSMISMLTVAVQQLKAEIEELKKNK